MNLALTEMRELLDEEHAAVRNVNIRTALSTTCLVGATAIGLLGPFGVPIAAGVAIGGAFLSVGQFVADHWPAPDPSGHHQVYAMIRDTRKRLGWQRDTSRSLDQGT
jgi:hypothetical protein